MTSPWKNLPTTLPTNGATVWVRRSYWGTAFLAVWDKPTQTFTHTSGLTIDWAWISRWRNP